MNDPQPNIRRAYRALLGNDYEQMQMEHITLSSAAEVYGPDFESAWLWQRLSVEGVMATIPPHAYGPILITDVGSAFIPLRMQFGTWYGEGDSLSKKFAAFVADLGATYAVFSYATGHGKHDSFVLLGTDGFIGREAHWSVEYKRRGRRDIHPMRAVEGKHKHYITYEGLPPGSDPTIEFEPWKDMFVLSDAAFEMREQRGRADDSDDPAFAPPRQPAEPGPPGET